MGLSAAEKALLNKIGSQMNRKGFLLGSEIDDAFGAAPKILEASGTLSQTNITTMFTTPVVLIAAPGAGILLVVDEIELFHDYTTTAFTSGGDVSIEYATSGVDVAAIDVAFITAAADEHLILKQPSAAYVSSSTVYQELSASANKALQITNATGVFATGHASNIFKYKIRYHAVTLLS